MLCKFWAVTTVLFFNRPDTGVCSDSYQKAQPLQMAMSRSLEIISEMVLERLQPKVAAKSAANEMRCLKPKSKPALTERASNFDLKIF